MNTIKALKDILNRLPDDAPMDVLQNNSELMATLDRFQQGKAKRQSDPDHKEDRLRYHLSPGDEALVLLPSCDTLVTTIKNCLSELGSPYEFSSIFEHTRDIEPAVFFPRVFRARIRDMAIQDSVYYVELLSESTSTQSGNPALNPVVRVDMDYVFVEKDDMVDLKALYKYYIRDTSTWLNHLRLVKLELLEREFDKLQDTLLEDIGESETTITNYEVVFDD